MNLLKKSILTNLLTLVIFLCVSCDQSPAPPYSRVAGQLLLEALEALENQQSQEAMVLLRQLVDLEPGNSFAIDALRREERRQILQEANAILATGDYHQLRLFLNQTEKAGASSPQLIALQDVADALETLAAVWARRPWENAADLEKALAMLETHQKNMADSASFQEILRNMRVELETLRKQELDAKISRFLAKLDLAVFNTDQDAASLVADFERLFSSHSLSYFLRELPNSEEAGSVSALRHSHLSITSAGSQSALAIAGVLSWEQLPATTQKELAEEMAGLTESTSLCQQWIVARQQDTATNYEKLFSHLRTAFPEVGLPPSLVGRYVSNHLVTGQEQQAWCWQSPCPGVSEWLARLQQIRMKAP